MSHSSFLCNEPSVFAMTPSPDGSIHEIPFDDAEAAWFWCVRISDAIHSGARAGRYINTAWGSAQRPCEAVDIQNVVLRLSHQKILTDRHVRVLSLYGKRNLRPAANTGARVYWQQAMNHMTPVLQRKGIVAL